MGVVFLVQKIAIFIGLGLWSIIYLGILVLSFMGKVQLEAKSIESDSSPDSLLFLGIILAVAWILGILYIRFIPKFLKYIKKLYEPESTHQNQ